MRATETKMSTALWVCVAWEGLHKFTLHTFTWNKWKKKTTMSQLTHTYTLGMRPLECGRWWAIWLPVL